MQQKWLKWKKIMISVVFSVPAVLAVFSVLKPDQVISASEKRRLALCPKLTASAFMDGSYMKQLEVYLEDQFAFRDWFRGVKAETETTILGISDAVGYYKYGSGIYKLEMDMNEKNIIRAAENFSWIANAYFPETDVYYAVIPDKNYYVDDAAGYPRMDYDRLEVLMAENMPGAQNISLFESLSTESYYKSDPHWRQECILNTAETLLEAMEGGADGAAETEKLAVQSNPAAETVNLELQKNLVSEKEPENVDGRQQEQESTDWVQKTASPEFVGSYAGASAFFTQPETLYYLTNDVIESAVVYDYEKQDTVSIYSWEKLEEGIDPYDFFLWGARALLTIKNPSAKEDGRKLLLFRDSFGSSIAPLLLQEYAEVTLIDLRYVTMDYAAGLLGETDYDDVLFLYSGTLLNHSDSMRF